MAIKAIFFDAAGTLIKPARRVGETYAVLARKYGIEVSAGGDRREISTLFSFRASLGLSRRAGSAHRRSGARLVEGVGAAQSLNLGMGFSDLTTTLPSFLLTSLNLMPGPSTRRWPKLCLPWKSAAWSLV